MLCGKLLQCIVVCCGALQRSEVRCSGANCCALQLSEVHRSGAKCAAAERIAMRCIVVCCGAVQRSARRFCLRFALLKCCQIRIKYNEYYI